MEQNERKGNQEDFAFDRRRQKEAGEISSIEGIAIDKGISQAQESQEIKKGQTGRPRSKMEKSNSIRAISANGLLEARQVQGSGNRRQPMQRLQKGQLPSRRASQDIRSSRGRAAIHGRSCRALSGVSPKEARADLGRGLSGCCGCTGCAMLLTICAIILMLLMMAA
jgi:hypothetical protein